MTRKILCVDDDADVLFAYKRSLRIEFDVDTALGGEEGLTAIESGVDYAVVVTDLKMPGMSGIQLMSKIKSRKSDIVQILVSGYADLESAMSAVNRGMVFRFLIKPVDIELLKEGVKAAVRQNELIISERELLEKTLCETVRMLTGMMSLMDPDAFGASLRVGRHVGCCLDRLGIRDRWQFEMAAILSPIGRAAHQRGLLGKVLPGREFPDMANLSLHSHPRAAARLLENIPRMERIAEMVKLQNNPMPLEGDLSMADPVALGSQILCAVIEYDGIVLAGGSNDSALAALRADPRRFHRAILDSLDEAPVDGVSRYQGSILR